MLAMRAAAPGNQPSGFNFVRTAAQDQERSSQQFKE
jgi:hypothetical protein